MGGTMPNCHPPFQIVIYSLQEPCMDENYVAGQVISPLRAVCIDGDTAQFCATGTEGIVLGCDAAAGATGDVWIIVSSMMTVIRFG
jgi:hypothetical protein